jgi:general secretion pathway protein H
MPRNGFTLVELLVVIAIMGLMASVVVMTMGLPGGGPADSATRFATRLGAARDAAILGGRPMSVWVSASGYGFDRFQEGRWQPLAAKPFEGGNWERGIQVAVSDGAERRMRLRFDSVGLPDAPASVRLARDGQAAEVRVAANGDVTVR